jgi:hypothetical protein
MKTLNYFMMALGLSVLTGCGLPAVAPNPFGGAVATAITGKTVRGSVVYSEGAFFKENFNKRNVKVDHSFASIAIWGGGLNDTPVYVAAQIPPNIILEPDDRVDVFLAEATFLRPEHPEFTTADVPFFVRLGCKYYEKDCLNDKNKGGFKGVVDANGRPLGKIGTFGVNYINKE